MWFPAYRDRDWIFRSNSSFRYRKCCCRFCKGRVLILLLTCTFLCLYGLFCYTLCYYMTLLRRTSYRTTFSRCRCASNSATLHTLQYGWIKGVGDGDMKNTFKILLHPSTLYPMLFKELFNLMCQSYTKTTQTPNLFFQQVFNNYVISVLVHSEGFKPPTPRSVVWYSIQLSYESIFYYRTPAASRTRNRQLRRLLL